MHATESHKHGDLCPSCDRFIGPADRCPYCGEASAKSPFIRRLRVGAVLLSFLGLGLLFLMATRRELPIVPVGTIDPMMNFAYVRVVGSVERDPRIIRRDGQVDYLSFPVDDGTGWIRVQAYSAAARRLVEQDRVPRRGMLVDVAGSLSVGAEGSPRLRLSAIDQLNILTAHPRTDDATP